MSISTLQEKLFNKGCGPILMVGAALAMGAGIIGQCGRAQSLSGSQTQADAANAVAFVGDIPVSGDRIQDYVAKQGAQDPAQQAELLARITKLALRAAALQSLSGKESFGAADIDKVAPAYVEGIVDQKRMQLMMSGRIPPSAKDAQVQDALKGELGGKTPEQFKSSALEDIKKAFADAKTKPFVIDQLAEPLLSARYGEKLAGDDASLRDAYRTYVLRRLFFGAQSGSSETPEARAKKAQEALKSGIPFDKLMDTVSNDPAPPGKAAHDATESVPGDLLPTRPAASLKGKPPLATTDVVDVPGGKAIYQLLRSEDRLPADFDKDPAKYRALRASSAGGPELQRRLDALLASDAVRWQSPGYHALAAAGDALADPTKMPKAIELAQAAVKSDTPGDKRLGALALLAATSSATGPERVTALETALSSGIEDAKLSLDLAKAYGDRKDGAKATEALLTASKANLHYDAQGQQLWGDINAEALKRQKAGVLTAAQLTQVQTQQAAWSAARADNEKIQAATKKQDEEARKANEAEIERQRAEAAKNAPKTPPASGAASAPGVKVTMPPSSGGNLFPPTATTGGAVPPTGTGATGGKGK